MIRRALTLVAVDGGIGAGKVRMRTVRIGKQDEEHSHLKSQMRSILNQECTVADK